MEWGTREFYEILSSHFSVQGDRKLTGRSACFHAKRKWLNICCVKGVRSKCKLREEWKVHFIPDNHFPLSLTVIDVGREVPHILLPTCVSNSHHHNNNNNNKDDDEYDNNKDDDDDDDDNNETTTTTTTTTKTITAFSTSLDLIRQFK